MSVLYLQIVRDVIPSLVLSESALLVGRPHDKQAFILFPQGLNDRFAMFIDKVRHLEQQNKVLETELVTLRQKQNEPSRIAHLYQQEMRDLRSQLEELSRDRNHILIERNNIEDELQVRPQGSFEKDGECVRSFSFFNYFSCLRFNCYKLQFPLKNVIFTIISFLQFTK